MHRSSGRSRVYTCIHQLIALLLIGALLLPSFPPPPVRATVPEVASGAVPTPLDAPLNVTPGLTPPEPRPPLRRPALAVQVAVTPTIATPDGVVTCTVRLANAGEALVHGVVLSGTLPGGLECLDCAGFYSPGNRRLFWTWGSLAAGTAVTVTFAAQVTAAAAWEEGIALALAARGVEAPRATRGRACCRCPTRGATDAPRRYCSPEWAAVWSPPMAG